jgi:hypothetical protein
MVSYIFRIAASLIGGLPKQAFSRFQWQWCEVRVSHPARHRSTGIAREVCFIEMDS